MGHAVWDGIDAGIAIRGARWAALPGTWIFSLPRCWPVPTPCRIHHLRLSPEQVVIDSDTQPNEPADPALHLGLVEVLAC